VKKMTQTEQLEKELDHMLSGFFGSEELSENIISELSKRGIPEKDLRLLQRQGFQYFRATDSFFIPLID